MTRRTKVVVSLAAESMLLQHTAFLANVSPPAARKFLTAFKEAKATLASFPLLGPFEDHPDLPAETYRKHIFYGRYKILYEVIQDTICIDAVVDCRQDF